VLKYMEVTVNVLAHFGASFLSALGAVLSVMVVSTLSPCALESANALDHH